MIYYIRVTFFCIIIWFMDVSFSHQGPMIGPMTFRCNLMGKPLLAFDRHAPPIIYIRNEDYSHVVVGQKKSWFRVIESRTD